MESAHSQSEFSFATAPGNLPETAGRVIFDIIRTEPGESEGSVTVSMYGSTSAPLKFIPFTNVITFPSGIRTQSVAATILDDQISSTYGSYNIALSVPSPGHSLGSPNYLYGQILEDDPGAAPADSIMHSGQGEILFSHYLAAETNGTLNIPIKRLGPTNIPISLECVVHEITAVNGTHFTIPSSTINILPSEKNTFLPIQLFDNQFQEGRRIFQLIFTNPFPAHLTLPDAGIQITIADNDFAGTPGHFHSTPLNPSTPDQITSVSSLIPVPDNKILAITDSWSFGYLQRLHTNQALDYSFSPLRFSVNKAWAAPDGTIYIAGNFSGTDAPNRYFARLAPDGTLDKTWSRQFDGPVTELLFLPDQKMVVLGSFKNIDGVSRPSVALLNADGTVSTAFNPAGFSGQPAEGIVNPNGTFVLFGSTLVATDGDITTSHSIRMFPDGSVDFSYKNRIRGTLLKSVNQDHLYMSDGSMLKRYFQSGALDPTLPEIGPFLQVHHDGRILIGSSSMHPLVDGATPALQRLFADGTVDSSFYTDFDGEVSAALPAGDLLLVGGRFNAVNGQPAESLAYLSYYSTSSPTVVLFNARNAAVPEGEIVTITVLRDGDASSQSSVTLRTEEGTAKGGSYFHALATNIVFRPGERFKTVPIATLQNSLIETTNAFFSVKLLPSSGAAPGEITNLTITILNDDISTGLDKAAITISETRGQVNLVTRKRSGLAFPAQFDWEIIDSGNQGVFPFSTNRGTHYVPAGELGNVTPSNSINFRTIDDSLPSPNREYTLRLISQDPSVHLHRDTLLITLTDNDLPGFPGDSFDGEILGFEPLANGDIAVFGNFQHVHGASFKGLVRLNQLGRVAEGYVNPLNWDYIYAVEGLRDNSMLVAGRRQRSGTNWSGLVKIQPGGNFVEIDDFSISSASPLNELLEAPDGSIFCLANNAAFNGFFFTPENYRRGLGSLRRLLPGGNWDTNFATTLSGGSGMAPHGNGFLVHGAFKVHAFAPEVPFGFAPNPILASNLVRFTWDGIWDTNFNASVKSHVSDIAPLPDGKILVAGKFNSTNGLPGKSLLRLNSTGELDPLFDGPLVKYSYAGPGPRMAVLSNGHIILSVEQLGYEILELDALGQPVALTRKLQSTYPFAPALVQSLPDGTLFLGGNFSAVDGIPRTRFARIHPGGLLGTEQAFAFLGVPRLVDGNFIQAFERRDDFQYSLQTSSDLTIWHPVPIFLQKGLSVIELPATAPSNFIRIKRF